MRWFVRGDVDGFFGLALDNLVQLLLIDMLCRGVLGFSSELIYGRVLPGVAVSLVVGNVYYAHQALKVGVAEGRSDVCALPYGINTVSLFAYVFLVMLPAKLAAEARGLADPSLVAWQAGLVACVGSGLIELVGSVVAERLRRVTPRAALLATLSGIALTFIALGFLFRTFARPVVGMVTLGIILVTYFGRVRFRGGIPGGFVAVVAGTAVAWATGIAPVGESPAGTVALALPVPVLGDLLEGLRQGYLWTFLPIILPMGLFNLIGSLQNIESAAASGDHFKTASSLAVNGLGTMAAALFGSCFPTTIYIGHPGWKALGARAGYSILNAVFFTVVILSGTLGWITWAVPVEAGMAIVLWIGLVISAQAFQVTPRRHAPAVVLGVMPAVAAWGAMMAKGGLRAAGAGEEGGVPFSRGLIEAFVRSDIWIDGAFALEQGFIFSAIVLAAAAVCIIERCFIRAALWAWAGALLSVVGFMHSYRFTPGDTVLELAPAWPWALGYTLMGCAFVLARWLTVPDGAAPSDD